MYGERSGVLKREGKRSVLTGVIERRPAGQKDRGPGLVLGEAYNGGSIARN